ncbi:MAG TPA: hypothetical protein PLV01_03215 [Candidatus Kapabacteria bacterium]|jgi:hypothetical protein|nr:hypothetical protein [Candidatus Kapabacteria bacterium]
MKKYLIIFFSLVCICGRLESQGFNWELSPRLPESINYEFIGFAVQQGFSKELGDFSFYEQDCNCGKFSDGNGSSSAFGLSYEKWILDGRSSLSFVINYNYRKAEFSTKQNLPILLPDGQEDLITYENMFSNSFDNITLNFEFKKRIDRTYYFVSIGNVFYFTLSNKQKHIEKILSPSYANPFPTNPPSFRRVVSEGRINKANDFNFSPFLSIGKDIDLGHKYYISPYIQIAYLFIDQVRQEKWKSVQANVGVKLMRWLK